MLITCTASFMEPGRYGYSGNASVKNRGHIISVQAIGQYPELPSGCEPTAAAMLLNWAGVNVAKEDAARAIPKGPLPAIKNGVMCGSSPDNVFIGDPFSSKGLGAFHEVIADLIDKYLPDQADDVSGTSFDEILSIIDSDRPVIVWSTIGLSTPGSTLTWYDENGKKVNWRSPEHVYLMVGYEANKVYVDDPNTGRMQSYPMSMFKERWEQMGRQAVTIWDNGQPDSGTAYSSNSDCSRPESPTVQPMAFAGPAINMKDIIKNAGQITTGIKNIIYSCYIDIKSIHIMSKLYSAAKSLYEGILYIADNM